MAPDACQARPSPASRSRRSPRHHRRCATTVNRAACSRAYRRAVSPVLSSFSLAAANAIRSATRSPPKPVRPPCRAAIARAHAQPIRPPRRAPVSCRHAQPIRPTSRPPAPPLRQPVRPTTNGRNPAGPPFPDARLDRANIIAACDASLRRLQTDYIDPYQFHWPDRYIPLFGGREYKTERERDAIPIRDTLLALKELLDAGKIRAYGLSNETTFGVCEFVRLADEIGMPRPATIQNSFCLLHRSFEGELAEACSPRNGNMDHGFETAAAVNAAYTTTANALFGEDDSHHFY